MKNRSILSLSSLAVMFTLVLATACKKKYDEPATVTNPGVTANKTIKELKQMYPTVSGEMKLITDDVIIRGIVVGNDRTGNIYKSIFIQDYTGNLSTSAGIQIDIDATGLYNIFPVGREVFVLAKGLYIANNANMIKLVTRVVENGTPSAAGIRQLYIDSYIKRGALNQKVDTTVISNITQLNNDFQGMLIRLNGFEVTSADLNKTYADTSVNKSTTNINLQSCGGSTIIVRTSGYANFAGVKVPQGNGTVTAIYTVFNTTRQLLIRDTSDLQLKNPRCGAGVPAGLNYMTIQQIRALGAGSTIPANTGIRGTIVSNSANEAALNYRLQNGSSGIQIRIPLFNPNPPYALNDSIAVEVSNLAVDLFNGDMQINNVANTAKLGTNTVTPRVTTVAQIVANASQWASTVVRLNNVTITPGTSNATGRNYTITETATGATIATFIRHTLAYTPPATATTITGYVSLFNGTPQLTLRVPGDVN